MILNDNQISGPVDFHGSSSFEHTLCKWKLRRIFCSLGIQIPVAGKAGK